MIALTVGHVTRDRYPEGFAPGGSVWYVSHAWHRLLWDIDVRVITAGADAHMPWSDWPASVVVQDAAVTTTFHNTYGPEGRTMRVEAQAPPVRPMPHPGRVERSDVLLLAPVAGEVDPVAWLSEADAGLKAAGLQGWLKQVIDGVFVPRPGAFELERLRGLDVAFLSDEDYGGDGAWLARLRTIVPRVYLTHGPDGCTLFDGADAVRVPARPVDEVDPTGAGDTFAAGTVAALAEGAGGAEAAAVGAALAARCVKVRGPVRGPDG